SCGFVMPRTVCKREITREEAEYYLAEGKTDLLTDFTSRFGRPFSATLVLKENGRHGFEFPPRKPRGAAAEASEGGEAAPAAEAAAKPARRRGKKGGAKKATSRKAKSAAPEKPAASAAPTRKRKAS